MSKSKIQKLFGLFLCFTLTFVFFVAAAQAQRSPMIQIFGKKPKNFDKAPDMKEFQAPAGGEFKANPTFFAATSDDERCHAIDLWLSSIRYEASNSSDYKNRNSYYWKDGVLNMENIGAEEIQKWRSLR